MQTQNLKNIRIKVIFVVLLICAVVIGTTVILVKCNAEPKPPVYELKLYDDNWEELEKDSSGFYAIDYVVAYDGTMKGINAICYMDGKEFFRYDYHIGGKYGTPIPVNVDFKEVDNFPTERGEYHIRYKFNTGLGYVGELTFHTPLGAIKASDLPSNVKWQMTLIIQ